MPRPGALFIELVRMHFANVFGTYGFRELDAQHSNTHAIVVMANDRYYLRITCDYRDRQIGVGLGKLEEGAVPPIPIFPARSADGVRELPGPIVLWLSTHDRDGAFALAQYADETPEDLDTAIRRLADAYAIHARPLLLGDERQWERAARMTVSRVWEP
jgi:hypothetical protein